MCLSNPSALLGARWRDASHQSQWTIGCPVESERRASREVEGCLAQSLRTVMCLSNPSALILTTAPG